ncbi:E3 ubiquitin-protein ligase UBR3-like [Haliotis rufescens]|uniref:E3 ubiquitin-protein ligase UBR3-like n=1 Tax=Haliotis rufescens TaxID=6454 RepID=UPI00201F6897|nr:E3 ubiquitin-protein ligase UBR3-like [Haliotis rufescens]
MAGNDMPSGSALLKRSKRSVATYFKGENARQTNLQKFHDFLEHLLAPQRPIDDLEPLEWCRWLIAGGSTFDEFAKTVRKYDNAVTCGLVWTAHFVAYRCRTCGISPCMSLCSDCFQAGNHEGHDYNMFRSQAGGACDCGDTSVMNTSGFCPRHGPDRQRHAVHMPGDMMANAEAMMPQVFLRLIHYLRDNCKPDVKGSYYVTMDDAEQFLSFLQSLSDMGAAMRLVMAEILTSEQEYRRLTTEKIANNPYCIESQKNYVQAREIMPYPATFEKYQNKRGLSQKLHHVTLLDELVFWMVKYEFPQRIVTLLLSMLPVDSYKEAFTRAFVHHYSRISLVLVQALDRVTVANRVVHISVQLFSNESLASKMMRECNLLYVLVLSLTHMIEDIRTESTLEDPDPANNFHNVVDCSNDVMKSHCYWPIISDLTNLLTHSSVASKFLQDEELVTMWMELLSYLQGMNLNQRELQQHVQFEADSYYAAFSAEVEIAASLMWSLLAHCKTRSTASFSLRMIAAAQVALQDWFLAINCHENMKPNPYHLTFHLPLHRYLAVFMMQAVLHQGVVLTDILPEDALVKKIVVHVLQIQVCLAQIFANMWVRNGIQIKGQAMTYIQCHFCYSMADADIYLLQVCASQLDPDYFVNTVLERFNILDWLSFSPDSDPGDRSEHEMAMVEGALSLFATLLGVRTYLGVGEKDLVRLEMASLLCMSDRQHSQLMDLMPEKSGVPGHGKELFEPTLKKIADYKAPVFAMGGKMQQGTYVPKAEVWEKDYDPVHVALRAIYRKDLQSSLDRYTEQVRQSGKYTSKTPPWPPFRSPSPVNQQYKGLYRILNCRTMHAFLFTVLHKALAKDSNVPESVLYHCVHLLDLCVTYSPPQTSRKGCSPASTVMDGKYHRWFSTSDIKQNACEVISEVSFQSRLVVETNSSDMCTISMDNDTSTLEEMFQLAPSAASSMGGPITAAQFNLPSMISIPGPSSGTAACTITKATGTSTAHTVKPKYESRGMSTEQVHLSRVSVNESLLSLLLKLHCKLSGKSGSYVPMSVKKRESVKTLIGDGPVFVGKLLDRLCEMSTECGRIVHDTYRALWPDETDKKAQGQNVDKETKRKKAWQRQQKLMAEFASKQKAFIEQTMEDDVDDDEPEGDEDVMKPKETTYDCVICGQVTPSTGDRPIGLVVFLQASSVLGHRQQVDHPHMLSLDPTCSPHFSTCSDFQKKRLETLMKYFEERSCQMSVNIGWEGGVCVQTCGHYLHLDCHSSYMQSLHSQSMNRPEPLAVSKGEYWCPLCRQLSNSVVPIVPDENQLALVKPVSHDPEVMVRDLADMMVTRPITPGSANLTRVMGNVMEDLTNATHAVFKVFSHSQTSESVLLFVCSVARTNLEIELLQRGGSLDSQQGKGYTKKNCFLPLMHVLSLHSKILTMRPTPYTDLWAHITGVTLSEESTSISVFHKDVPLLLKDATSLLIQLILTLPATIKEEHFDFLVQMLYNVVYIQAMSVISCKFTPEEREAWRKKGQHVPVETMEGMLSHIVTRLSLSRLFEDDDKHSIPAICQSVWSPHSVEDSLQEFCLPFLRMAALLKHNLFDLEIDSTQDQWEFQFLSSYLGLQKNQSKAGAAAGAGAREVNTTACVSWAVSEPLKLTRAWCTDLLNFIGMRPVEGKFFLVKQPTWFTPRLVELPAQYYKIFQTYRNKQCAVCNKVPRDPTICLMCGHFLCFRDNCCKEGMVYECVQHSITCGGGIGIFLLVNSSVIIVIRGPRATLWGSVFLDEHGEEDRDLKRGKPLYLSKERYELLQEQWLSHSFDRVCKKWIWHRDRL